MLSVLLGLSVQTHVVKSEELGGFGNHIFMFQQKLANRGNVLAQYKLGTLYEFGVSVKPNVEQARKWYQLAAKKGYKPAINRNTYLDIRTSGFSTQNHGQWLAELQSLAETLDPNALILLGQMHRHGIGVKKDLNKSMEMLSEASALGHTEVDSEIDQISLEIDEQEAKLKRKEINNQKNKQKKQKDQKLKQINEAKRKQKEAEAALKKKAIEDKRRRFNEALKKQREEALLLEQQQNWSEQ